MKRLMWAGTVVLTLLALGGYGAIAPPAGPRSIRQFDPHRLADLELRMWQAYYARENVHLFRLLVIMLRQQYHYSWATAASEAFHLARAAATFGNARSDYEQVLPDLEAAYSTARDWTAIRLLTRSLYPFRVLRCEPYSGPRRAERAKQIPPTSQGLGSRMTGYQGRALGWLNASFDPAAVAHAELAWWVARRSPGQNSPERVGDLIADEYAMLYEAPRAAVLRSARRRAEAAALRDRQASAPDWDRIARLLTESYVDLHAAVHQ